MKDFTTLQCVWFILISVLWLGYFLLEGFDFGVGMLLRAVGRNQDERRAVLHSIGPLWDGNEVWLIVAGGATFAAFPDWYATLFSGFYVALFAILLALIVRNVVFEFWGKEDDPAWRSRWEWAMVISSGAAALLWGVGWANIVHGVPIDSNFEFTGSFFTLLNPYALLGGVTTLALFCSHGALFLTMRTKGEIAERASAIAVRILPLAALLVTVFLAWTILNQASRNGVDAASAILAALAAVACGAAVPLARSAPAKAFAATAGAVLLLFSSLFVDLFPNAMVSTTSAAFDMTLNESSSSNYTLTVMTVVAVALVPVVIAYQAWTYWVFRHRVGAEDFGDVRSPLDLLDNHKSGRNEDAGDADGLTAPANPAPGGAGPRKG